MNSEPSALALLVACERLSKSRRCLQLALCAQKPAAGTERSDAPSGALAEGLALLQSLPGAGLLLPLALAWWEKHPYRLAGMALSDFAKALVVPTAERHPWRLIAGAFVAGGLLVWSRPWRWRALMQ